MDDFVIRKLDISDSETARRILEVQRPAYEVEARLIGFYGIPGLRDTVDSIRQSGETFYGCFVGDTLAGVVAYKVEGEVLDIYRLVVSPSFFRRGIGGRLVDFVAGAEEGICRVIVSTGAENLPGKALYEKKGFREVETVTVEAGLRLCCFEKKVSRLPCVSLRST